MRIISLLFVLFVSAFSTVGCSTTAVKESNPIATHAESNEVVFYVTRHGKTMFNSVKRAQGWADTPLTRDGVAVAQQLGKGLRGIDFVAVYSSDLGRARETAQIVLTEKQDSQPILESKNLREACFGIFEGDLDPNMWGPAARHLGYASDQALLKEMAAGKVTIKTSLNAIAAADSSGQAETFEAVQKRYMAEMYKIAEKTAAQGGGNVLLISHGVAMMVLINSIPDTPTYNHLLKNASVTKIIYRDGRFYLDGEPGDMSYVQKGAKLRQ